MDENKPLFKNNKVLNETLYLTFKYNYLDIHTQLILFVLCEIDKIPLNNNCYNIFFDCILILLTVI